ncbi:MAG TPA: DUF6398 domain-containing protein [Acidimicrobiales bacterium]|nr:DUF6398 domain-containing protein [Acidimicrobiales bacterium]
MARRDRHRRGGRVTPKGPRPNDRAPAPSRGEDDEPDLLATVRDTLATGEPLDLLVEVSTLVAAVDPRSRSPVREASPEVPSLADLVGSFAGVDRVETTALLAGVAVLAPDEALRGRARRQVADRAHQLPDWLLRLGRAQPGRTMAATHVLGDGETIMVEVTLPGTGDLAARTVSAVVYVDHNLGTVAKDAVVVPGLLDELVATMQAHDDAPGDTTWADLDPAAARARLTEAIDTGALVVPPLESETWPASRPLVEWAARLLPEGGAGYRRPDGDDPAQAGLTEAFLASPQASHLGDPDHRELAESMLWFATDHGPGDPLRWSPTAVEILLTDWLPRKIAGEEAFLAKAPEVLRALISYAHAERGVRAELTAETLQAVDQVEPDYQEAIRSPRPQGPTALLAAMGALDPEGTGGLGAGLEGLVEPGQVVLEVLRGAVGGEEALGALDDRALPDEAFAWEGVDPDIAPAVSEVLAACDRCCDEALDVEYRTACRRFLARAARGDPAAFHRRGHTDTAAAVCWTVGKANDLFTPEGDAMAVSDLLGHFGVSQASVAQRATTLLRAAGVPGQGSSSPDDLALGDPGLLVAGQRRRFVALRDRYGEG